MKIIIDIPDNSMDYIDNYEKGSLFDIVLINAIKNGTLLPKNHGRLIDADELRKNSFYVKKEELISVVSVNDLIIAPTIIEAEGSDEK